MRQKKILYKNSEIHYYLFGNGPQTVVCLHGYGESGRAFGFLDNNATDLYTFYSIDLPFHGESKWKEGLNFSPEDILNIIEAILLREERQPKSSNKFILLGFSLGGRVALSLYDRQPEVISKLVLLAPDGLKINFWYWLATQTYPGNKLFALTMNKPAWFFGFLKILNKAGFVNASIFKFVNYYISDKQVRDLLYSRWTAFRNLKPNLSSVKTNVLKYQTQVRLLYGKHDRIILPIVGEKFRKGIERHCKLTIIPSGHQLLHEKHKESILSALQP